MVGCRVLNIEIASTPILDILDILKHKQASINVKTFSVFS